VVIEKDKTKPMDGLEKKAKKSIGGFKKKGKGLEKE